VLQFLKIAGNGGHHTPPDPIPLDQTEGLSSLRYLDPTPSPRGRAPDSGPGTTGHGGVPPLLQIAGHVEHRGANKKLTSVLPATKVLAKMTNCIRRAINLNNFFYIRLSLGLLLLWASRLDRPVASENCPYISVLTFTFTDLL